MYEYILGATYSSNIGIDDIHDIQDIDISPMVISIASSPLLFFLSRDNRIRFVVFKSLWFEIYWYNKSFLIYLVWHE